MCELNDRKNPLQSSGKVLANTIANPLNLNIFKDQTRFE